MTTPRPLLYAKHEGIATITFNRPEARNALTPEMLCRLAGAIVDFAADAAMRVAILTGTGSKAFCAGGDLALTLPLLTGAGRRPTHGIAVCSTICSTIRSSPPRLSCAASRSTSR
jgi:enoyl-CoA hydratase/carnithine racemase